MDWTDIELIVQTFVQLWLSCFCILVLRETCCTSSLRFLAAHAVVVRRLGNTKIIGHIISGPSVPVMTIPGSHPVIQYTSVSQSFIVSSILWSSWPWCPTRVVVQISFRFLWPYTCHDGEFMTGRCEPSWTENLIIVSCKRLPSWLYPTFQCSKYILTTTRLTSM